MCGFCKKKYRKNNHVKIVSLFCPTTYDNKSTTNTGKYKNAGSRKGEFNFDLIQVEDSK